jgi:DNA sulfur modification protein DndD
MSVRIEVRQNIRVAFEVTRKWYFRANGTWDSEEVIFREIKGSSPQIPRKDGIGGFSVVEEIDNRLLPAHIAPFFFFDGEEVRKLADQARIETVKQGLEGLLGIVLLRQLSERLRQFENNKRGDSGAANAPLVEELGTRLAKLDSDLSRVEELQADLQAQQQQVQARFSALIDRISAAGGTASDVSTVRDLVEERQQYRQKLDDLRKQMEDLLGTVLPLLLVEPKVTQQLKEQLSAEQKLLDWDIERKAFAPRLAEFKRAFFEQTAPTIEPALLAAQVTVIKSRMVTAWESLFHPPPAGCAAAIELTFIAEKTRLEVLNSIEHFGISRGVFEGLLSEASELEKQIQALDRRVTQLEGIDRDGTLQRMKGELEQHQKELDRLNSLQREAIREQSALATNASSVRAEYEREKKRLDAASPTKRLIEGSEKVRAVIDELMPQLFPMKVKALGKAMSEVFQGLAHKSQVAKIEVREDGTARLLSATGREIAFDQSAGENQIFATALIAGLAKVANVRAPLVVDTPLARLDGKHRTNIFNFWTSDRSRQVILLSQDKEIDAELLRDHAQHVCQTYLLEHQDIGEGIGRTTPAPNKYFTGVKL